MEKTKSWEILPAIGEFVKELWRDIAVTNGLKIEIFGLNSMSKFRFLSNGSSQLKTILAQEMMGYGFLATTAFNASLSHTEKILEKYSDALELTFKKLSEVEKSGDYGKYLIGPVANSDFKRMN
jgi:hypothetical protein